MKINILLSCLCLLLFINNATAQYEDPKREVRAVWISTAYNLDWPSEGNTDPEKQQQEMIRLLDEHQKNGINTIYFQVRAAADAFYNSNYEPWSNWLTGKQGKAPTPYYDPLDFVIKECRKRNMEIHAWFNLFRAVTHEKFFPTTKEHVSKRHADWLYPMNEKLLFNPGVKEVRDYLVDVVIDVVKNYDIDGVHLDDYFYYQEKGNLKIKDQHLFKNYKEEFEDIGDWRRHNINLIIKNIHERSKSIKPYIKFGISPVPVWRHQHKDPRGSETSKALTSYDDLYADARLWLEKGWIDYIAPQFYWHTTHKNVNYNTLLEWWGNNTFGRHLYIGHAVYRSDPMANDYWKDPEEACRQLKICRKSKQVCGLAYFRSASFNKQTQLFTDSLKYRYHRFPALIPPMPWIDSIAPNPPNNLSTKNIQQDIEISWQVPSPAADGDLPAYYVIYRFDQEQVFNLNHPKYIVGTTRENRFTDNDIAINKNYVYVIRSVDRLHNESKGFIGIYHDNNKE